MGIREWSRLPEGMLLQSLFLWLLLQYHWEFPPSIWVLLEHMMFKSLIGHSFLKACSVYLNWQDNVDLSLYSTLETLASFPVEELQMGRPLLFSETPLNWLGPWISTWAPSVLSVGLEPESFPRSSSKLLPGHTVLCVHQSWIKNSSSWSANLLPAPQVIFPSDLQAWVVVPIPASMKMPTFSMKAFHPV